MNVPRLAFFTDSFHEVNGVARTSREFVRFASKHEYPMFSVHTGPETVYTREASLETYEIRHSRLAVRLEVDLAFDPLFIRHRARIFKSLRAFRPDVVHVTGPGHCGLLGAVLAYQLRVPLVASWHTNVHEFGARRLARLLHSFPRGLSRRLCTIAERGSLALILQFYKFARLLFAPNPEIINTLERATGRPAYLMVRGVDTSLFSPAHRDRSDNQFVIGYVGRLSSEKNVRLLVALERELMTAGLRNYKFLIVGDGSEREFLSARLHSRELTGVLHGQQLAQAYANMDVFVFPSETDTFGNVILEAMASGVPPIVSSGGGPKYIVRSNIDGFEAADVEAYAAHILALYYNHGQREIMSRNARAGAASYSWDSVFGGLYQRYTEVLEPNRAAHAAKAAALTRRSAIETMS